ncbi:MAG TPA: beta-ketoacyl synthase N-terminal-like domain-containing protein, partial [Stellaceae bacterium]|nr:beta-ketoacyl synthase N-terminal-like domain-containing protein [Stellaceae bacterium]
MVSSLGAGRGATLSALRQGRGALRPCQFETVTIPTYIGQVDGVEDVTMPAGLAAFDCRNNRLALMALSQDGFLEAVAAAKRRYGAHRIGVFAGTSTAGILETELAFRGRDPADGTLAPGFHYRQTQNTFSVAEFTQSFLGLTGPAHVVSAACASTAKSFADAARMILLGVCDAAIVGGADSLCLTTLYGFHSLQLISTDPCRPYDA